MGAAEFGESPAPRVTATKSHKETEVPLTRRHGGREAVFFSPSVCVCVLGVLKFIFPGSAGGRKRNQCLMFSQRLRRSVKSSCDLVRKKKILKKKNTQHFRPPEHEKIFFFFWGGAGGGVEFQSEKHQNKKSDFSF